jgi:hypothetical protein
MIAVSCKKETVDEPTGPPAASEGEIAVDGGGEHYGKKVFIDLSENTQTAVDRTTWDLGFYTGDEFRVILNSSTAMMARALDKNDMNAVTAADSVGFYEEMSFNAFSTDALPFIDYPDGDLSKTAIAAVSSDAALNKVYIVNRGTGVGSPAPARGWKKIRVLQNGNGYTLQYADIDATAFSELQISKSDDHFFNYVSFDNGQVQVDPAKDKWDLAWTFFSNVTSFGGGEIPYAFQDFILTNRNVQAAMVPDSVINYDGFAEADISGLEFSGLQNSIGADWRGGGGPNTAPSIKTDRYYVIKDAAGNYYKVRFTSLTRDGERGYPSLEFTLVKKGTF